MEKDYLHNMFLRLEEHIANGNYVLKVINKDRFKGKFIRPYENLFNTVTEVEETREYFAKHYTLDPKDIDEQVCNLMICKWLLDHKDKRYRDFTFVLKPNKSPIDMRHVSFEDLMHFISPQTRKTRKQ